MERVKPWGIKNLGQGLFWWTLRFILEGHTEALWTDSWNEGKMVGRMGVTYFISTLPSSLPSCIYLYFFIISASPTPPPFMPWPTAITPCRGSQPSPNTIPFFFSEGVSNLCLHSDEGPHDPGATISLHFFLCTFTVSKKHCPLPLPWCSGDFNVPILSGG